MATEHLLEQFPPVSTAAWEAAIARDLKGADYEKRLIWRTDEGLAVKPYYRAEDLDGLVSPDAAPGDFPYRRGAHAKAGWRIREVVDATDAEDANRTARATIAAGAEEIAFAAPLVASAAELKRLVANLDEIPLHFERADEQTIRLLLDWLNEQSRTAPVSTGQDALANVEFAAEVIQSAPTGFLPFAIHGDTLQEAGATAVEEVGFALAAAVDFLAAVEERGVSVDRAATAIEFGFATGANYFFEIAKLRAFRMMWARAVESFGGAPECARAQIAARTSRWNKTVYDPHVNILRATTEAMAAVLGGADSVTVTPFDECYKQPDEASRRLARNTQLLLKHESCFGCVADPAGGSYYVETITDFLAREGWRLMQQIERRGGYRKALVEISRTLEKRLAANDNAVASRRRVMIGTNQFANPAERALARVDEEQVNDAKRGARAYEQLRLRSERHEASGGKLPRVILAEIGDAKMRAVRSNYAANFFACAGFAVAAMRFKKAEEIAETEGDLIVLCTSDAEYAPLVAELMPKLKALGRKTPVIVAGNPADAEQLAASGIADFIHARSNPIEVLTRWQQQLGVKG
jgi:methylmalonyl-CoA mutase